MNAAITCFFFFKQKTAYEMRISDWSSDVCSSDLVEQQPEGHRQRRLRHILPARDMDMMHGIAELLVAVLRRIIAAHLQIFVDRLGHDADMELLRRLRSEERRVGKECVRTCRSRWSPEH